MSTINMNPENKSLMAFQFEAHDIRTMIDDKGNPWFSLKDVCEVLAVTRPHPERLDSEGCRTVAIPTSGGLQETVFVDEGNLYEVVMTSRKQEAKKFKKWVTREVIPQIRKTGLYLSKPMSALDLAEAQVKAMREMESRQDNLEVSQSALTSRVDAIEARIDYTEDYLPLKAWYHLQGKNLDMQTAKKVGMALSQYCRENNIKTSKAPDQRFGEVNAYPVEVLKKMDEICGGVV